MEQFWHYPRVFLKACWHIKLIMVFIININKSIVLYSLHGSGLLAKGLHFSLVWMFFRYR
jgi:hypothetical protein